jgi:hypothetical protein
LCKVFKNRDCFTLIRPVGEESELQRLNSLPDHALRGEFIKGVNELKEKIFKNAEPKYLFGEAVMGGALVSMMENFVEVMNSGGIPKIKTAW